MPPAAGTQVYAADQAPVVARGYSFSDDELDAMLAEDVGPLIRYDAGAAELAVLLTDVATTEFANEALGQVLRSNRVVEAWRVGEAIAEAYLVEHRQCEFPWPGGRDLRNPDSSPTGTDLVGRPGLLNSRKRGSPVLPSRGSRPTTLMAVRRT